MLPLLSRWFRRPRHAPTQPADWRELSAWADSRGLRFCLVRDGGGFVIEGQCGATAWRLEWGASQRSYFEGQELRFRAELPVAGELQVLLLSRSLMAKMEASVFEQYVQGVQTRIDTQVPPEMRWLVMFPKLGHADMHGLHEAFGALGNHKPWLCTWLGEPLQRAMLAIPSTEAVVLMVARSRLTGRTLLEDPCPRSIEPWLRVFDAALREALRACQSEGNASSGEPTTQPAAWPHSQLSSEAAATGQAG